MMHLGLLQTGDKVAVPALAWSTTYAPLIQHGLDLILLDADNSWCAARDADWIMSHKSKPPKLIITCGILGNPAHGRFWHGVAKNCGAVLMDDCCESVGAVEPDGTLCGTRGLANTFSFYFSHQLSAVEGGMILTNDEDFAIACRRIRNHGWTRGTKIAQSFGDEFEFTMAGYNVRPLELHSAIARVQLRKLKDRIYERQMNDNYFCHIADTVPIVLPKATEERSPFCLHFEVSDRETRQCLANALRANGIDCRPPIAGSFGRQPYGARWADQRTPVADRIHDTGMAIGCAPFPIPHLIDKAVKVMREVL